MSFSIFICLFHHNLYIFFCSAIKKSKENRILYLKGGLFTVSYQVFSRGLPQLSSTRWSYKTDLLWFSTYLWGSFHLAVLSVAEPYLISNCFFKGGYLYLKNIYISNICCSIEHSINQNPFLKMNVSRKHKLHKDPFCFLKGHVTLTTGVMMAENVLSQK